MHDEHLQYANPVQWLCDTHAKSQCDWYDSVCPQACCEHCMPQKKHHMCTCVRIFHISIALVWADFVCARCCDYECCQPMACTVLDNSLEKKSLTATTSKIFACPVRYRPDIHNACITLRRDCMCIIHGAPSSTASCQLCL